MDEQDLLVFGTEDKESPGFIALMTSFIKVATRLNSIAKHLKFIDESQYDTVKFNLKININELSQLGKYEHELSLIPGELELNRMKSGMLDVPALPQPNLQEQQVVQQQVPQQAQQPVAQQQVQPPKLSLEQQLLYGMQGGYPPAYPQQPAYPQLQQPMQPPAYPQQQMPMQQQVQPPAYPQQPIARPIGINSAIMQPMTYQQQPMAYPQQPAMRYI
jgi:hypothetical protein